MTERSLPENELAPTRRTVLKGMGATALGVAALSGTASAHEDCESGGGVCACFGKIDGVPELDKKYYFENGEITACVKFTEYLTKDDGEVYGARWEVCDSRYPVCKTLTKGGPYARVRESFGGFEAANAGYVETCENPKNEKRYGLSNVQFYFCVPSSASLDRTECKQSDKWPSCPT